MTSRTISAQDVDDLAVGSWIIGTGGGGSPYLNHLNVQRLAEQGQTFELVDPGGEPRRAAPPIPPIPSVPALAPRARLAAARLGLLALPAAAHSSCAASSASWERSPLRRVTWPATGLSLNRSTT